MPHGMRSSTWKPPPIRWSTICCSAPSASWVTERPVRIGRFPATSDPPPGCPANRVVRRRHPRLSRAGRNAAMPGIRAGDPARPAGRVIVVDDASPEPKLSAWLGPEASGHDPAAAQPAKPGLRQRRQRRDAGGGAHDVALLNSDTEVPAGWLARLAGHAYAEPRVASVSPLSNNATICGYPSIAGGDAGLRPAVGCAGRGGAQPMPAARRRCRRQSGFACISDAPRSMRWARLTPCIRPWLWRGSGFLSARRRPRMAAHVGLRHLCLSCRAVSFGGRCGPKPQGPERAGARWPILPAAWSAIRPQPGGTTRFARPRPCFIGRRPVILLISHGLGGGVRARSINWSTNRRASDVLVADRRERGVDLRGAATAGILCR